MRAMQMDAQLPTAGKTAVPYPDWGSIINAIMANGCEMLAGTVAGTGAAIDVTLPFDPAVVWCCKTAGTSPPVQGLKHPGLADDDFIKTIAAGTVSVVTTGGITLGSKKFTIGTDAGLNENTIAIRWIAFGFRDRDGGQ